VLVLWWRNGSVARRDAARSDPWRADLQLTLARALAKAGRPDEAHPHFVAARRLAREASAAREAR
jgi:hypothetical protein